MGIFENRKRPFYWRSLFFGIAWFVLGVLQYALAEEHSLDIAYMVLALGYVVIAFVGKPDEPKYDPRPMSKRLRETMANYTPAQLQAILDDKLRSEEVKAVAKDLLSRQ